MKRSTFARLAVLLFVAGALALSGCGGDDNGVDESLQNTLTAERDTALQAQMVAEKRAEAAEQAKIDAEKRAEAAEQAKIDAEAQNIAAMQAEMNARGKEITKAIIDMADTPDGIAETIEGGADTGPPLDANVDRAEFMDAADEATTGLSLKNTAADGLMVTPMEKPLQFEEYVMAADGSPMIEDWQDIMMMRRNNTDNASQIIYAYTDIEPATMKTFGAANGLKVDITTMNIGRAESSEFPSLGDDPQKYAGPSPTPNGNDDVDFVGTFDDVMGTFGCTSLECTITVAPDGTLLVENELIFTPNDASDMVTVADADYLYFGLWLHKPDDMKAAHPFNTFFGGMDAYTVSDAEGENLTITDKIGRARYEGPSAGKYVTRNLAASTTNIGIFTATAKLLADFEASNPHLPAADRAPGNPGTIRGTISDFMENGESLGNWRVTLNPVDLSQLGNADPDNTGDLFTFNDDNMWNGTTTAVIGAEDVATTGHWQGQFFDNDRADGDPGAVAGRFDVHNDHATLAGAFGVTHTDE